MTDRSDNPDTPTDTGAGIDASRWGGPADDVEAHVIKYKGSPAEERQAAGGDEDDVEAHAGRFRVGPAE